MKKDRRNAGGIFLCSLTLCDTVAGRECMRNCGVRYACEFCRHCHGEASVSVKVCDVYNTALGRMFLYSFAACLGLKKKKGEKKDVAVNG